MKKPKLKKKPTHFKKALPYADHVVHWVNMGTYFGFPECCIGEFVLTAANKTYKHRPERKLRGTGFVPCTCCEKKYTEEQLVDMINSCRNSELPKFESFKKLDINTIEIVKAKRVFFDEPVFDADFLFPYDDDPMITVFDTETHTIEFFSEGTQARSYNKNNDTWSDWKHCIVYDEEISTIVKNE